MLNPLQTCCFAGYRPEKVKGWDLPNGFPPDELANSIEEAIIRAYNSGYLFFISGMSRGFDLWAAQKVIELKENYPIKLFCALPFDGQTTYWPDDLKKQYQNIILNADFVYSISRQYKPDCFYIRNRFMVDGSSRLICFFDGTEGGTSFTLKCAKRKGLEIDNLYEQQMRIY